MLKPAVMRVPLTHRTDIENSTHRIQSYTVTRSRDQSGTGGFEYFTIY